MTTATAVKTTLGNIRATNALNSAGVADVANSQNITNGAPVTAVDGAATVIDTLPALIVRGGGKVRVQATVSGVSGAGYTGLGQLIVRRTINGGGSVVVATSDIAGPGATQQVTGHADIIDATPTKVGDSIVYTASINMAAVAGTNTILVGTGLGQLNAQEVPS